MTQNHSVQHDYMSDLLNNISLSTTWEIAVSLSVELTSPMWFIIIDRWINMKEERMMYHRKNANTVYVYSENRVSPRQHNEWAKVIIDTIWSVNYAHDNGFEQMYIFRKSMTDIIVKWGQFYINQEMVTIPDLDTELWTQHLAYGQDNYIYIHDSDYLILTTPDDTKYLVGIVSVEVSGSISVIDISNTLPMSQGLSDADRLKLDQLNHNAYEKLAMKVWAVRIPMYADDDHYPSEKAVSEAIATRQETELGKWLSSNDYTDQEKQDLQDLVNLDLANANFDKLQILWGSWILVQDLWDDGYRIKTSTNNAMWTTGEHIDIYPLDDRAQIIYRDTQKYVILEDEYRSGLYGNSKFKDASNPSIAVYYYNPNNAGKMAIDTHIRVVNGLGVMTEVHQSIPYTVDLVKGHGVFDLKPESFTGLDYINSTVMYINLHRVGAHVTDVNWVDFNDILNDKDSVKWEVRIKSMYIDYEQEIDLPQAWYAYVHDQFPALNNWYVNHDIWVMDLVIQCYNELNEPIEHNWYTYSDDDNIIINFSAPVEWRAVILSAGWFAPAPLMEDKNYEQIFSEINGWANFTHSLNKYPSIMVIDDTWNEIITNITHIDRNNVAVTWTGIHTWTFIAN